MRLTKIYNRNGDDGTTRLANGEEVSKSSLRVSAYGDIDELNSSIGVVLSQNPGPEIVESLSNIQHSLFDAGGELASAGMIKELITPGHIKRLEEQIDTLNQNLPPLEEFILPGGTVVASNLHLARTICRRAERHVIELSKSESVAPVIIQYLNRLSDLLFVMARYENHSNGNNEILWKNPRK
ncbi:MAG: cob(I)yrinic acid a,c-diamide adenosyltransferase [Candidatus Marinimicrobia bacterium]|nr:cob(I)yrinic acid a,c-diamide adenosyltransferase [Candidatus Neomarinimicrobiota bacterium]